MFNQPLYILLNSQVFKIFKQAKYSLTLQKFYYSDTGNSVLLCSLPVLYIQAGLPVDTFTHFAVIGH